MRRMLLVLAMLLIGACAGSGPSVVPSPLPPTMVLTVSVVTGAGQPVTGAIARIEPSIPVTTGADGVAKFRIIFGDLPQTHLTVLAAGYRAWSQHIDVGATDQVVHVTLSPE